MARKYIFIEVSYSYVVSIHLNSILFDKCMLSMSPTDRILQVLQYLLLFPNVIQSKQNTCLSRNLSNSGLESILRATPESDLYIRSYIHHTCLDFAYIMLPVSLQWIHQLS